RRRDAAPEGRALQPARDARFFRGTPDVDGRRPAGGDNAQPADVRTEGDDASARRSFDDLIPDLMRFFGGTPTFWRHEVSVADVRRCLEAIPRLRAAEALEMVTRLAVGMGRLKRGAATAIIRDWER